MLSRQKICDKRVFETKSIKGIGLAHLEELGRWFNHYLIHCRTTIYTVFIYVYVGSRLKAKRQYGRRNILMKQTYWWYNKWVITDGRKGTETSSGNGCNKSKERRGQFTTGSQGPNMQILTNSTISPFPITFMTPKKIGIHLDAKWIDLWSNFNCKLRDWSTRHKILDFFISVSSIACQEHYIMLVKTSSFLYNHTGYLLFTQWISYAPKCKISKREVRSVTKQSTFGA